MLLPLAAGLGLNAFYEGLAARVKPVLDRISNVSVILLVFLITAANIDKILQVRHIRNSCRTASYRIWGWNWLAAWRT
jgi:predicted Na+-dependent transporter